MVSIKSSFSSSFQRRYASGAAESAKEVVPRILDLVHARSVIDLGCGTGAWLAAYAANGVEDYCGIDGPWVSPELLMIPQARFQVGDLRNLTPQGRRYDIVQSLEVAEHLEPGVAKAFVATLVGLGDVVVFSAAIPNQGGTHHVNEQWHGYWRTLFAQHSYKLYDLFRPELWLNDRVSWWYAQNMFLYVRDGREPRDSVNALGTDGYRFPEKIVHPGRLVSERTDPVGLRVASRQLVSALARALSRTLRRAQ